MLGIDDAAVADSCACRYALQHGYLLVPAYTFGESDTYSTLGGSRLLDIMQQNFGVILPIFWG